MHRLPPFAAIRAFEAAARHESFKHAAAEIGVTPTAISHQIRQLEASCGRALFSRSPRQVVLTPAGRTLAEGLRPALEDLAKAFARVADGTDRACVTLGAGPLFVARWLVPRLAAFWEAHPDVDLRLHHSPLPVWRQLGALDLAVAWGHGGWPGCVCEPLLRVQVTAVVSPSLLAESGPLAAPEDLLRLPLLHHRDSRSWRQWFEAANVTPPPDLPGSVFEDANVLHQAGLAGRGAILGIPDFISDDLETGRLVQPFPTTLEPEDAYFMVYRQRALASEAVAAVKDWLTTDL